MLLCAWLTNAWKITQTQPWLLSSVSVTSLILSAGQLTLECHCNHKSPVCNWTPLVFPKPTCFCPLLPLSATSAFTLSQVPRFGVIIDSFVLCSRQFQTLRLSLFTWRNAGMQVSPAFTTLYHPSPTFLKAGCFHHITTHSPKSRFLSQDMLRRTLGLCCVCYSSSTLFYLLIAHTLWVIIIFFSGTVF